MKPSDVPEKINSMKIVSAGYTETPFENQHLFKNAENPKSKRLWYIERKTGFKRDNGTTITILYGVSEKVSHAS